jgi:hypothetical protein
MVPKAGYESQVAAILDDLLGFYATQPGYIEGYSLLPQLPGGEMGRLTVWNAENDAEATAHHPHVMAQRSELLRIVADNSRIERSFEAERRAVHQLVVPAE